MTQRANDPLYDLWESVAVALRPFGVIVGPEVLWQWREQWECRCGPFWAAERGYTDAIDEAIRILRELRGPDREVGYLVAD